MKNYPPSIFLCLIVLKRALEFSSFCPTNAVLDGQAYSSDRSVEVLSFKNCLRSSLMASELSINHMVEFLMICLKNVQKEIVMSRNLVRVL